MFHYSFDDLKEISSLELTLTEIAEITANFSIKNLLDFWKTTLPVTVPELSSYIPHIAQKSQQIKTIQSFWSHNKEDNKRSRPRKTSLKVAHDASIFDQDSNTQPEEELSRTSRLF